MGSIDWLVMAISVVAIIACAIYTQRYVRSVADFVAGGRVAGRYLLLNARGEAGSGIANTLSKFQFIFVSGFVLSWWDAISMPILLFIGISGFVLYRYRQTRAMTLGQFFEMRYSRNFRLFAGVLGFIAGLLNYGIFPAIGSKFFVYFLDLPERFHVGPLSVATYIPIMAAYLLGTVWMMITGGQVTLMVTDCVEGILSHAVYVAIVIAVFVTISWSQMQSTLTLAPPHQSLINPFDALAKKDFNVWYVMMTLVLTIYSTMAWQNGHGFNSAAHTPHELRMSGFLFFWRYYAKQGMLVVLVIGSMTYLRHPDFFAASAPARQAIAGIADSQVRDQMTVPITLRYLLPAGVKGLFCTIMLLGLIAGDASHMLSWGGIFIQDVVLPFRKTPLAPSAHVRVLRWSVAGVALFAFVFSIAFRQTQYITLWWAITMGVFTAGAGAAIIGGLYWSRGTTAGAWAAILGGGLLSGAGIIGPYLFNNFPFNGTQVSFIAAIASTLVYIGVSLATCREVFNMDRLLHRNAYAVAGSEPPAISTVALHRPSTWLNFNSDFTRLDRIVSAGIFVWSLFWLSVVAIGTLWNLIRPWPKHIWIDYWFISGIMLPVAITAGTFLWFAVGGAQDLQKLFVRLATAKRDATDDGTVVKTDRPVIDPSASGFAGVGPGKAGG